MIVTLGECNIYALFKIESHWTNTTLLFSHPKNVVL